MFRFDNFVSSGSRLSEYSFGQYCVLDLTVVRLSRQVLEGSRNVLTKLGDLVLEAKPKMKASIKTLTFGQTVMEQAYNMDLAVKGCF